MAPIDIKSQVDTKINSKNSYGSIVDSTFQSWSFSLDAVSLVLVLGLLVLFTYIYCRLRSRIVKLERDLCIFVKFTRLIPLIDVNES